MGRFAHLLERDVFAHGAAPAAGAGVRGDPAREAPACAAPACAAPAAAATSVVTTVVTSSPLVHRVPRQAPPASADRGPAREREDSYGPTELQPALATQMLFQQCCPLSDLQDLQVVDEDDSDGAAGSAEPGACEEDPARSKDCYKIYSKDSYTSALSSALAQSVDAGCSGVEAELLLPGSVQNSAAVVPFDLGLGQIQSAYAVERFESALSEDDASDDDSSSLDSSACETISVGSCGNEAETSDELPLVAVKAVPTRSALRIVPPSAGSGSGRESPTRGPGPRVVPVSPWSKRRARHPSERDPGAADTHGQALAEAKHAEAFNTTEFDTELAYIKGAMQKTEKLLQKPFAVCVPQVSGSRPTRAAPPVERASLSSDQSQGTVGLMLWPAKNKELIITGFEKQSQAVFSGLILGDAVVDVNGENIEGLSAQHVADRLSGPMGTKVSLGVSRIISDFKTHHVFILARDVLLGSNQVDHVNVPPANEPWVQISPNTSVDACTSDPIIMSLQSGRESRTTSATDSVDSCWSSGQCQRVRLCEEPSQASSENMLPALTSPHAGAPTATAQDTQWSVATVEEPTPHATTPHSALATDLSIVLPLRLSGASSRAALLPSPRGSTKIAASGSPPQQVISTLSPPVLSPPQQVQQKLRRPLSQIQHVGYPREAYVKTSPVAQLQVSSPEVGPHNIRSDSISPQASQMLFERMITPRKGLGAPSGAKPRRVKGDWKKCEENKAPQAGYNSPLHVGSVKILKPVPPPQNDSSASVPQQAGLSSASNRPPLNCVRSVGTLVQPHIVDHTRLHLDVAAEVPMVAAFKPLAQQASVGVQCCHTADTSDELHYDEAVVADLEVFSGVNKSMRKWTSAGRIPQNPSQVPQQDISSVNDLITSISAIISPQTEIIRSQREDAVEGAGREADGVRRAGGAKWKFPMPAPNFSAHVNSRGPPREHVHAGNSAPWSQPPRRRYINPLYTQPEDFTVAELLNSAIPEMEVGC